MSSDITIIDPSTKIKLMEVSQICSVIIKGLSKDSAIAKLVEAKTKLDAYKLSEVEYDKYTETNDRFQQGTVVSEIVGLKFSSQWEYTEVSVSGSNVSEFYHLLGRLQLPDCVTGVTKNSYLLLHIEGKLTNNESLYSRCLHLQFAITDAFKFGNTNIPEFFSGHVIRPGLFGSIMKSIIDLKKFIDDNGYKVSELVPLEYQATLELFSEKTDSPATY